MKTDLDQTHRQASSLLIGSAAKWPLAGLLLIALTLLQASQAATFTVTNTSGSEATVGSLPWALYQAWYNSPGSDTVNFNIPGAGPHYITLQTSIPLAVGDKDQKSGVVIDGTTQPGYSGSPLVVIDANGLVTAFNVTAYNSRIKGLGIYNFSTVGIALLDQGDRTGRHFVDGCWIGFKRVGSSYDKNTDLGHSLSIGIAAEVPYNVITNNTISGVYNGIAIGADPVIDPSSSSDYWISHSNYISNNRIGTTPDGTAVIGNLSDGVFLGNGATYNHIAYNTIGGNASAGVELLGASGVVNYIYGNFIGVGADGSNIGNGELGVLAANRSNNNYTGAWVANYVYYNSLGGIAIGLESPASGTTGDAHYNAISYNVIYANNDGAGNGVGVSITGGSWLGLVQGNNIFGHSQHGVIVSNAYNNWVTENWLGYYVANYGYGVYTQYSSGNVVTQNNYGTNWLGSTGSYQSADYILD